MEPTLSLEQRLPRFGPFRRQWHGAIRLPATDAIVVDGDFTLAQRYDATVILGYEVRSPALRELAYQGSLVLPENADLTLPNADTVAVAGRTWLVDSQHSHSAQGETTTAMFYLTSATIGAVARESAPFTCVFDIVNFLFQGTQVGEYSDGRTARRSLSLMPLRTSDGEAVLEHVPEYDLIESHLRARKDVQVTCTATLPLPSLDDIPGMVEFADRFTDLMSICRGTVVSWISYDIRDASGFVASTHLKTAVVKDYTGFELLPRNQAVNTREFIEHGLERFSDLNPPYQVRRLARAYADTRGGPFLETRGLLVAVLAEYIAATACRLAGSVTILDEVEFEGALEELEQEAVRTFRSLFPNLSHAQRQALTAKLRGLNFRSLGSMLRELTRSLAIPISASEIEQFVDLRNSLAHTGQFPGRRPAVESFLSMMSLLDRVVLKLFGYSGNYIDPRTQEPAEI